MDEQGRGGGAPVGRVGSPTVVDITAKLGIACDLAGITQNDLKSDLAKFGIDPRTVGSWFKNPTVLRAPSRDAIVQYFRDTKKLPFDHKCFMMTRDKFEEHIREKMPLSADNLPRQDVVVSHNRMTLDLADDASILTPAEKTYICGKYQTFRLSASDTSKVVTEIAAIRPRADDDYKCDVAMYCNKVDDDSAGLDELVEEFIGNIFKFGSTYLMILTYSNGLEDRRPRVIQFPLLPALRRDLHFGIITGYSLFLEDHFSGRIIAHKLGLDTALGEADQKKVRRVEASDEDVARYAAFLLVDPRQEGEKLITVDKKKMTAFARELRELPLPSTLRLARK